MLIHLPRWPINGKNQVSTGMGVHTIENGNLSRSNSISIKTCWFACRGISTEATVESVGEAGDDEDI